MVVVVVVEVSGSTTSMETVSSSILAVICFSKITKVVSVEEKGWVDT